MPGVGKVGLGDFKAASQGALKVVWDLGSSIQWVHNYVTDLYRAFPVIAAAVIRLRALAPMF